MRNDDLNSEGGPAALAVGFGFSPLCPGACQDLTKTTLISSDSLLCYPENSSGFHDILLMEGNREISSILLPRGQECVLSK